MFSSKFGKDMGDFVFQPAIHGVLSSLITTNVHNADVLAQLATFQSGRLNSYLDNFIDGFVIHLVGQNLAVPIDDWLNPAYK